MYDEGFKFTDEYNTISISKNEKDFNNLLTTLINSLLALRYELRIRDDGMTVMIDFNYERSLGFGGPQLEWVQEYWEEKTEE